MNNYIGVVIEESLEDKRILKKIKIIKTVVEKVTQRHETPWIKQWTLHTVQIPDKDVKKISKDLSESLDSKHEWYIDFKNKTHHYIIFRNKIFLINRTKKSEYDEATKYGISKGIPYYQVDFSPHIKKWKR